MSTKYHDDVFFIGDGQLKKDQFSELNLNIHKNIHNGKFKNSDILESNLKTKVLEAPSPCKQISTGDKWKSGYCRLDETNQQLRIHGFSKTSSSSSSTLSLHIAAYENSNQSDKQNDMQKRKSSAIIQTPYEYPRQPQPFNSTPEVMQFKTSQKLVTTDYSSMSSSSAATTTNISSTSSSFDDWQIWLIIGCIGVGAAVIFGILIVYCCCFVKERKKKKTKVVEPSISGAPQPSPVPPPQPSPVPSLVPSLVPPPKIVESKPKTKTPEPKAPNNKKASIKNVISPAAESEAAGDPIIKYHKQFDNETPAQFIQRKKLFTIDECYRGPVCTTFEKFEVRVLTGPVGDVIMYMDLMCKAAKEKLESFGVKFSSSGVKNISRTAVRKFILDVATPNYIKYFAFSAEYSKRIPIDPVEAMPLSMLMVIAFMDHVDAVKRRYVVKIFREKLISSKQNLDDDEIQNAPYPVGGINQAINLGPKNFFDRQMLHTWSNSNVSEVTQSAKTAKNAESVTGDEKSN